MKRIIRPGRLAALAAILAALVVLYVVALYKLQIIEGAAYYEMSQNSIVSEHRVTAARGNLLDRYGRVLISNRLCNNIVFNTDELFKNQSGNTWFSVSGEESNAVILRIVNTVISMGDTYTDTLPVTMEPPFEYVEGMTNNQRAILIAYLKDRGMDEGTSAVDLMAYFRTRYGIAAGYDARDTRIIAGVRYEINSRHSPSLPTSDYIFAQDVSIALITKLMEGRLPGVEVQSSYIREINTDYAAHILGYTGPLYAEDMEQYPDYSRDAAVGKEGAEYAFEEYLHGSDGTAAVTRTATGTVTSTVYTKSPEPGNHVYLTIDIGLQKAAELALASEIEKINAEREVKNAQAELYGNTKDIMQLVSGGAVVAIDIKTGEPLCIASYPTFSLKTFSEDYARLNEDVTTPLWNRALNGTYAPGSTFKPVTALAALNSDLYLPDHGPLTINTEIYDEVTFMKYQEHSYTPSCWIKGTGSNHGNVNVTGAIAHSCNYYFYTVGDQLGIERLAEAAKHFGLGEHTGIELAEKTGAMSSEAYKREIEGDPTLGWYQGDQLPAVIGQSYSNFTPLQLANYTAALASNGTLYKASILRSVRSYDYSDKLYERVPEIMDTSPYDQSYYDAVKLGMYQVTTGVSPTVTNAFAGAGYTVAAKTGTAERGEGETNNAVFICYAPYENPEIADAVVVEKGGSGSAMAVIARNVLDYYFSFKNSASALEKELSLLK